MKRHLLLFLPGLLLAVSAFGADPAPKMPSRPVRVLFLGDSLSDYDRGSNHLDRLQRKLDSVRPRYVNIYNYAIRGDFIERMVDRFNRKPQTYAQDRYNGIFGRDYDWAIVHLGQNDTRTTDETNYTEQLVDVEKARTLYGELVALLKSKGIRRIILMSPASLDYGRSQRLAEKQRAAVKAGTLNPLVTVHFGEPKRLEAFRDMVREVAMTERIEFLDIYTPMKALPDKADCLKEIDGVHLTAKGHEWLAEQEFMYLTKAGKGKKVK